MNAKSLFTIFTLLFALALSGSVTAQKHTDKVPPAHVLKFALNLDNEQATALRDLIVARMAEVKIVKEEIGARQAQLDELLKTQQPDPLEVGGLVLDIRELKQVIAQGHDDYQQSFRALLRTEQVQRLNQINRVAVAERAAEVLQRLNLH